MPYGVGPSMADIYGYNKGTVSTADLASPPADIATLSPLREVGNAGRSVIGIMENLPVITIFVLILVLGLMKAGFEVGFNSRVGAGVG